MTHDAVVPPLSGSPFFRQPKLFTWLVTVMKFELDKSARREPFCLPGTLIIILMNALPGFYNIK